jgi:glycosyltransferase involved in cell wall biosynthesis
VYINKQTKGPIANFGFALSHAIGDVIFLSDQDDVWADGKVKVCLEQLRDADLVLSDCKITDGQLNVVQESFFQLNKSGKGLVRNLIKNSYIGCCMAFRKELLPLVLPFPRHIPMHDIWIGFVGELFYKTRFMEQKLVYYRRHEANASVTSAPSPFGIVRQLLFRFNVIRYFPLLIFRKMKNRNKNTTV